MSDFDLDALLDDVVLEAALADGRSPLLAARQFGAARAMAVAGAMERGATLGTANRWTAEDEAYLARWSGVLGTDELARRLGRTPTAVDTQQRLRGLARPTSHPEYITGQQMADALGVDAHAVIKLIARGKLAAELAPFESGRVVWRMKRTAFYAWATNPANWVYFWRSVERPERIADEKLRRLIARRRERWDDAWWTPGEVAAYHGVSHIDVNRYIRHGRLPAVKWDNWRVLRSEATRPGFRIYRIADGALHRWGTPGLDAFLVLAYAVGIPNPHIARMTGGRISDSGVVTRHRVIIGRGLVPWLTHAYGLPVELRDDGLTWADWRRVAHRFPRLARVWAELATGEEDLGRRGRRADRALLCGVLGAFLRRHGLDAPRLGQGDAGVTHLRQAQLLFEETLARPCYGRDGHQRGASAPGGQA